MEHVSNYELSPNPCLVWNRMASISANCKVYSSLNCPDDNQNQPNGKYKFQNAYNYKSKFARVNAITPTLSKKKKKGCINA